MTDQLAEVGACGRGGQDAGSTAAWPVPALALEDGTDVLLCVVPYGKQGHCTGPQTLEHLVTDVRGGDYSDVFVFSHGWNNDWASATGPYDRFLGGYTDMRTGHGLTLSRGKLRPLLAGVFWPSAALVLPWEEHPAVATGVPADNAVIGAEQQEIVEPAQALGLANPFRLYALAQEPESIRLKHIRDGYEDYEYPKFLSGHEMGDEARTIATGLFPRPSRPAGPTPKCGRPESSSWTTPPGLSSPTAGSPAHTAFSATSVNLHLPQRSQFSPAGRLAELFDHRGAPGACRCSSCRPQCRQVRQPTKQRDRRNTGGQGGSSHLRGGEFGGQTFFAEETASS